MKKIISFTLVLGLLALALASCGTSGNNPLSEENPLPTSSSLEVHSKAVSATSEPKQIQPATVFLPANLASLGQMLSEMAAEEGFSLEVKTAPSGAQYTKRLADALQKEENLILYWVEGEAEAAILKENGALMGNLLGSGMPPALQALANLTPKQTRILDAKAVYGLPLGLYGEGTLVDLVQITHLLGSNRSAAVLDDLIHCTPAQWEELINTVHTYLLKSQNITLRLSNTDYTLQRYRPEEARPLRSIFALPTAEKAELVRIPLANALAARYATPGALLAATPEQRAEAMRAPLEALFAQLELETLHMSLKGEPSQRGEPLLEGELVNTAAAETMFAEGSALFLPGSTQDGLRLEAEHPRLQGRLALLPNKLPLPQDDTAANLAQSLLIGTGGTLCMNAGVSSQKPAQTLLLRLFSSEEGLAFIEQELGLLAFSNLNPQSPLLANLATAVSAGGVHPIPVSATTLAAPAQTIGGWLQTELLYTDEWAEEQQAAFLTAAKSALGYPIEENMQTGSGSAPASTASSSVTSGGIQSTSSQNSSSNNTN